MLKEIQLYHKRGPWGAISTDLSAESGQELTTAIVTAQVDPQDSTQNEWKRKVCQEKSWQRESTVQGGGVSSTLHSNNKLITDYNYYLE
jgi:hypothetical protein